MNETRCDRCGTLLPQMYRSDDADNAWHWINIAAGAAGGTAHMVSRHNRCDPNFPFFVAKSEVDELRTRLSALTAENARLRGALERVLHHFDMITYRDSAGLRFGETHPIYDFARSALADAQGEQKKS